MVSDKDPTGVITEWLLPQSSQDFISFRSLKSTVCYLVNGNSNLSKTPNRGKDSRSLSPLFPQAAEPGVTGGAESSLHARQLTHWILRQFGERNVITISILQRWKLRHTKGK